VQACKRASVQECEECQVRGVRGCLTALSMPLALVSV
jgi:hypothetical protein